MISLDNSETAFSAILPIFPRVLTVSLHILQSSSSKQEIKSESADPDFCPNSPSTKIALNLIDLMSLSNCFIISLITFGSFSTLAKTKSIRASLNNLSNGAEIFNHPIFLNILF